MQKVAQQSNAPPTGRSGHVPCRRNTLQSDTSANRIVQSGSLFRAEFSCRHGLVFVAAPASPPRSLDRAANPQEYSGPRLTVRTKLNNGMNITVFVGETLGDAISTSGVFEATTARTLTDLLGADVLFFDISAHAGQYTLLAAPLAREIHCFELMPWLYEVLRSNIRRNGLANAVPKCVSSRPQTLPEGNR